MKRELAGLLFTLIIMSSAGSALLAEDAAKPASATKSLVSLDLKDVDVKTAIQLLFQNSDKNYSIDKDVDGTVPVVKIKNLEFDTALKTITKLAGLTYKRDNSGVYYISRKPDAPSESINYTSGIINDTPGPPPEILDLPKSDEIVIRKVKLRNIGASEMLSMLGIGGTSVGMGQVSVAGSGGFSGGFGGYGGYSGYGGYNPYSSYGSYGGYGGYGGIPGYGSYGSGNYNSYSGYGGYSGYGRQGYSTYGGYSW